MFMPYHKLQQVALRTTRNKNHEKSDRIKDTLTNMVEIAL